MTRTRAVLLACLVTLVAAWAATTATLPFGSGARPTPPPVAAERDPGPLGSLDLEAAAQRLHARVDAASRPSPPSRNPFRFGSAPTMRRDGSERVAGPAPAVPASLPFAPTAPPIALVGVAEHSIDGAAVRTAVLSMAQQLYYVKAGERVGAAYEVVAVEPDAVEVKDLISGGVRRLKHP